MSKNPVLDGNIEFSGNKNWKNYKKAIVTLLPIFGIFKTEKRPLNF